jgi:D-glycero-alpha-D-manno-heptose-7-phosphate kinase
MIITQAPVRISFLGGGSDFPRHFERHGGAVLTTAIDRFAYVTIQRFQHQFFDHRLRIAYRKTENPRCASEVSHPAIRACFQKAGIDEGAELHHMADLPARTGLGSSSSFVVAMIQALSAYQGRFCTPETLANEAIDLERNVLQEAGGHQDQVIAAYGGTCLIRFNRNGKFHVTQIPLPAARLLELQEHLLLMYTGIERDSFSVLKQQVGRIEGNHDALCRMSSLAEEGANWIADESIPITDVGELLHASWMLKRTLSEVSLPAIDDAYEAGLRAGASGGKLLGAGQGGFLLFIAKPEKHDRIRQALPGMLPLKVGINAPGSRVIFAQGD